MTIATLNASAYTEISAALTVDTVFQCHGGTVGITTAASNPGVTDNHILNKGDSVVIATGLRVAAIQIGSGTLHHMPFGV